ncbi:MAG TPA: histidine kinase [Steroidobacteraceae bacterium]|jgi:two-component system sensor histidine kinase UhpB
MTRLVGKTPVPGSSASLRLRLVASVGLVLVLILVLGGIVLYWHAIHEVEVELHAAIAVGEHTVHNAVDDSAEADNPMEHLQLLVADFDGDRHLQATLVSRDGKLLARSTPLAPSDPAPQWFYRLLASHTASSKIEMPWPFTRFGIFYLDTNPRNEIAEVWSVVVLTLAMLATFCGLTALLVYWVTGRALQPLDEVSDAYHAIGAGNYRLRVRERVPREFARLCHGFNQMAARLDEMEERKLRLEHQLAAVQDEERAELARDLHDEMGPLLFAVSVDLSVVLQDQSVRATPVASRIESIRDSIAHLYKEVKAILARLRPANLVDLGLAQAVEHLVQFWRGRYPGIEFAVNVPADGFGEPFDDTIYHLIQESLNNAMRHGKPSRVQIRIVPEGRQVLVEVRDDGIGIALVADQPGFGLIGMRERVRTLGGTLTIGAPDHGRGVLVAASLPLPELPESSSTRTAEQVLSA